MNKQGLITLLMMEKTSAEVRRRGSNYAKGYENGIELAIKLIEASEDEPQKPVVPQFVADWYEEHKDDLEYNIWEWLVHGNKKGFIGYKKKFLAWLNSARGNPIQTLVNMHQFGYEVEKEAKYTVKVKATKQYLCNDELGPHFSPSFRSNFTKTNLEELGFGWVFSCEGVEIEEV